ncbi:MAG: D-alanine--D-alanine ligase [Candidatus Sabulitectum sp.]|nr:D-alanine--D-alanine ligase [Candidatus Sabulitectum sp.]
MNVLVLSGGRSAEREISLLSADWVSSELKAAGHTVTDVIIRQDGAWIPSDSSERLLFEAGSIPWRLIHGKKTISFDVVFPVLHGSYGEDGTVQGLCATAGWPCAGVPVMGSSVAMEKHTLKRLASHAAIPVVPWVFIDESYKTPLESLKEEIASLGFPLFVKPSRLGSSVGIGKANNVEELAAAIKVAAEYDSMILIEKAVDSPREIEVSVVGDGSRILSSVPGEVLPGREWYDYTAKYQCDSSKLAIPASLSASYTENIRMMAENAFRLLGGRGFARVDFLMNSEGVWLNEVNTIPGFTSISMFPKLWEATGMASGELLKFIIEEALDRAEHGLGLE